MNSESESADLFVGRQQEMAVLEVALDESMSGQGRMVMLAGEPGIGKTRLAHEFAGLAEQRGAYVLWGWCYEHRGAPPYWPWLQCLRTYNEKAETGQLRRDMGPGAADLSEILPELTERFEGLERPPALDPEQARFRLFFSITTFLRNVSRSQPLVLVLDDLHWADESSLLLLEFLTREIAASPVLVIGTYRHNEVSGSHPLAQTLGNLVRESHFRRLYLEGFSRHEVRELVEARAGVSVEDTAVDALHQRTEGNPLFVREVVGSVAPEEIARDRSWIARIPEVVRDAILRRLGRLSEPCNQLLRNASIIGRDFDFHLLRALSTEFSEDEFRNSLDEALSIRIIEPLPNGTEGYRFSHALIQQAMYGEIPSMLKAQAHAQAGETLERIYSDRLDEHAGELARHFAEAGPVAVSDKLVKYTMLAGEKAFQAYAFEEALGHFRRGLMTKGVDLEGVAPAPDAEAAALLFGLGRAQAASLGRRGLDVASSSLSRAFDYYVETDDINNAVRVAQYPILSLPGRRGDVKFVARALELLPANSPEAGRLLSRYAFVMGLEEGDYQSATEAFDGALAIAKRTGDVALEMRTLAQSSMVDYWHLRWPDSVAKGLRVIELAHRSGDQLSEVSSRFWAGIALLNMGKSNEARQHASAMMSAAERLRDRYWQATSLWLSERASGYEGDWQAARGFNQRGLSISPSDARLLGTRMLLEHETGNAVEGDEYRERLVEALRQVAPGPRYDYSAAALMITIVARITDSDDQLDIAESAAATVLSSPFATPLIARYARLGLGLMAVLRGDVEAAEEQYHNLGLAAGSYFLISGDRVLGLLARTMGNLDRAMVHFQDARAFCLDSGYLPELAWTCYDYAELLQRVGMDDQAGSKALLEEGLALATKLGMIPLMEFATSLQERLIRRMAKLPVSHDGLTKRELEVLRLITSGKTDKAIADELFIGVRTVSFHVSNILNKTDSANRTEAASYANQRGLA